jgi:hypothetical protein
VVGGTGGSREVLGRKAVTGDNNDNNINVIKKEAEKILQYKGFIT